MAEPSVVAIEPFAQVVLSPSGGASQGLQKFNQSNKRAVAGMLGSNSQLHLRATRAETLTAGIVAVDGC